VGYDSRGFELPQRFDLGGYPKPRPKRTGPTTAPQEDLTGGAATAFTRVWQFRNRVGISQTFNRNVSPAMIGPAIVKSFTMEFSAAPGAAQLPSWMLGYSETPLAELLDQALPATFPGTKIIDTSFVSDGPQSLPLPGGSMLGFGTQQQAAPTYDLDFVILAPAFVLYFVADAIANADHSYQGSITVINQVSQRTLQLFGL